MKTKDLKNLKGFLTDTGNRIRTLEHYFGVKGTVALMEIAMEEQYEMGNRSFTPDDDIMEMLCALDFIAFDPNETSPTSAIIGEVKYTWDGEKWEEIMGVVHL